MIINKFTIPLIKNKIFDIDVMKLRGKNFHKRMIQNRDNTYKKLKNYLITKDKISCRLCKKKLNHKNLFLKWKKYKLIKCNFCESINTNIDFRRFTPNLYHSTYSKKKFVEKSVKKNILYRAKKYGNERIDYIFKNTKLKKKTTRVLDFACGYGSFLFALKKNNIFGKGLDFDLSSVNFCKSLGLQVSNKDITEEKDHNYDLITMFDVIEHLHNPLQLMLSLVKKLKKGGYIVMFTPNINSFSNIMMGFNHNNFSIFDHVCFYNEKSINYLCKKSKLKLIKVDYFGLDIKDYFQSVDTKYNNLSLNTKLNDYANLTQSYLDYLKISNSMRIILKKS